MTNTLAVRQARTAAFVLATLAYSGVLLISYRQRVSPLFAYEGLTYRTPDPVHLGMAVGLVTLTAATLPRSLTRGSDYLQWMLFVIATAPAILLAQVMTALSVGDAMRLGVGLAAGTTFVRLGAAIAPDLSRLRPGPELNNRAWLVLLGYSAGLYAYLFMTTGIPTTWVDFADVYDVRSEFITATGGTLLGYLLPIQYNVVNPILIARGWFAQTWTLFWIGVIGQVVIYLEQGQKGVLLSVAAMLGIIWMCRGGRALTGARLLTAAGAVALVALILDAIVGSFWWTSLVVRRFLVVPGALTVGYVSVFQTWPKAHFYQFGIGESPYGSDGPSYIVGREFLGYPHGNANVNLWGNGYMNAGYLGMFVMAVLFVLLLWVIDAATDGLPAPVVGAILLRMAIVLASANLATAMLSHGLLALIVFCVFLPRDGWALAGRQELRSPGPAVVPPERSLLTP